MPIDNRRFGSIDADGTLSLSAVDLAAMFAEGNHTYVPRPGTDLRCSLALPHPAVARDDVLLQEVHEGLLHTGHGPALADPAAGEAGLMRAVQNAYQHHPEAVMAAYGQVNLAMYAAVNLCFGARDGRVLRATDALETLLLHTDADDDLPTSMFRPPHPAVYIHFGTLWQQHIRSLLGPALALCGATPEETTPHGCYLLESRYHCAGCKRTQRNMGLYIVTEFNDQPGLYVLCGGADEVLHDEDAPLSATLVHKLNCGVPGGVFGSLPSVVVGLLAKLFLYMQSDAARAVRHDDRAAAVRRLEQLGARKRDKLTRRLNRLHDWTEVGPAELAAGAPLGELPPHWRRGHLRHQAHGPQHSLRKLIFIMPTLVRADALDTAAAASPARPS